MQIQWQKKTHLLPHHEFKNVPSDIGNFNVSCVLFLVKETTSELEFKNEKFLKANRPFALAIVQLVK
jgi:hypothetical protein